MMFWWILSEKNPRKHNLGNDAVACVVACLENNKWPRHLLGTKVNLKLIYKLLCFNLPFHLSQIKVYVYRYCLFICLIRSVLCLCHLPFVRSAQFALYALSEWFYNLQISTYHHTTGQTVHFLAAAKAKV